MRAIPNYEEMRRKARKKEREAEKAKEAAKEQLESKRPKIDIADEEEDDEEESSQPEKPVMAESAVDITERFVFSRLQDPGFATELVLVSMTMLPSVMPPHFNNTYTPIAAAGTEGQVKHVSRLLATQLTNAGLGPGVTQEARRQEVREAQIQVQRCKRLFMELELDGDDGFATFMVNNKQYPQCLVLVWHDY